MVCNLSETDSPACLIAFTLNRPSKSVVAIRVMNASELSIDLHVGQKIDRFLPVVESIGFSAQAPSPDSMCASVSSPNLDPSSRAEL